MEMKMVPAAAAAAAAGYLGGLSCSERPPAALAEGQAHQPAPSPLVLCEPPTDYRQQPLAATQQRARYHCCSHHCCCCAALGLQCWPAAHPAPRSQHSTARAAALPQCPLPHGRAPREQMLQPRLASAAAGGPHPKPLLQLPAHMQPTHPLSPQQLAVSLPAYLCCFPLPIPPPPPPPPSPSHLDHRHHHPQHLPPHSPRSHLPPHHLRWTPPPMHHHRWRPLLHCPHCCC
eukprot:1161952-Pelagomonas_calceolata.AAC.8